MRTDEIQNRFDQHFEVELGLAVISLDLPRWTVLRLGPQVNYGWAYPIAVNPAERDGDVHAYGIEPWADEYISSCQGRLPLPLLLVYSPEVIDASTLQLDADELDRYLTSVEYLIDRYVALRIEVLDPKGRVERVEDDLYEVNPEALAFLTSVQMATLPVTS